MTNFSFNVDSILDFDYNSRTLDPPKRWIFPEYKGSNRLPYLKDIAKRLQTIQDDVGFDLSVRGWCYLLSGIQDEDSRPIITKGEFDHAEEVIKEVRLGGLLSADFFLTDESRAFEGLEVPTEQSPTNHFQTVLRSAINGEYYMPDYWKDEHYYIQLIVEKVDLKSLFGPICRRFHIPVANMKGWSDINSRVEIGMRFKAAEAKGMVPVLLYCGDHDPHGLKISDSIRSNFESVSKISEWSPTNLIFERFGLNYDFIEHNNLIWIDSLISGGNKDLYKQYLEGKANPIVVDYIRKYCTLPDGTTQPRKCEANALVAQPALGRRLFEETVLKYLGKDAERRMAEKDTASNEIEEWLGKLGVSESIKKMLGEEA